MFKNLLLSVFIVGVLSLFLGGCAPEEDMMPGLDMDAPPPYEAQEEPPADVFPELPDMQ